MTRHFTLSGRSVAAMLFLGLSLTACRKNAPTEDTGFGNEHSLLEKTFSDVQSICDQAGVNGNLSTFRKVGTILGNCATVTQDTLANPHLLTIDFGPTNCLGLDGNYRRGQILVSYSGAYRDPGHTHTISFNQYFVNDNGVSGTKTVTQTGNNAQGQPVYSITVQGSIALANNSGTISWSGNRTRTWTNGYATLGWQDDEYDISGNSSITRANGSSFSLHILTPLHAALNCRWIESGVVEITPQNAGVRTLDYGNGACDAQANYTVNGKTYSISLK